MPKNKNYNINQQPARVIAEIKEQKFYKQYVKIIKQIMFDQSSLGDIFYLSECDDGYVLNMNIIQPDYLRIVNLQKLYGSKSENVETINNLTLEEFEQNKFDEAREAVIKVNAEFKEIIDDIRKNIASTFKIESKENLTDDILWNIIKETDECKYNLEIETDKNIFSEETGESMKNDESDKYENYIVGYSRNDCSNSLKEESKSSEHHQNNSQRKNDYKPENKSSENQSNENNLNHVTNRRDGDNFVIQCNNTGNSKSKHKGNESSSNSGSENSKQNSSGSAEHDNQNQEESNLIDSQEQNNYELEKKLSVNKSHEENLSNTSQHQFNNATKDNGTVNIYCEQSQHNQIQSSNDPNNSSSSIEQNNSDKSKGKVVGNIELTNKRIKEAENLDQQTEDNELKQEENNSGDLDQNKDNLMYLYQELNENNSNDANIEAEKKQCESRLNISNENMFEQNNSEDRSHQTVYNESDIRKISTQASIVKYSATISEKAKRHENNQGKTNYPVSTKHEISQEVDYEIAYHKLINYNYSVNPIAQELQIGFKQKAKLFFWMLFHHPLVLVKSWFSSSGYSLLKHALLFESASFSKDCHNKQNEGASKSSDNKRQSLFDVPYTLITEDNHPLQKATTDKKIGLIDGKE